MTVRRILVTGWRNWPRHDAHVIHRALDTAVQLYVYPGEPITVVEGACPYGGADTYAREWATRRGHGVESHPASRDTAGRLLGPERNAEMVAAGADVCVAFPGPRSRGTYDCMRRAVAARIPTYQVVWGRHHCAGGQLEAIGVAVTS